MTSYDDNGFRCDGGGGESGQAGCQLQCYINYEPVSVGTFWVVAVSSDLSRIRLQHKPNFQLIVLLLPCVIFNMLVQFIQSQNEYKVCLLLFQYKIVGVEAIKIFRK